jgi:hypothetical protein
LYGCKVMWPGSCADYLSQHKRDAGKLARASAAGYLLSLVAHPMGRIPERAYSVVKYPRAHNAAVDRFGSAERLHQSAEKKWLRDLAVLWPTAVQVTDLDLGCAYGIPFRLGCYLAGPLETESDA